MDLETLAIRFFTSGEDAVRAALQGISDDGEKVAGTLSGPVSNGWEEVTRRVTELISVWAAAELFKHMIEEAGQLAIKLEVFSQQTGISSEKLAELGEQAELSFVPVDSLQSAFRRLAMGMGDAQSRSSIAMRAMGLDIESFHGDTGKAFEAIAEKFANYKDDANKSALLTAIFGRGAQLTPLLNQFKETQAEVRAMGTAMTDVQKDALLKYEQAMIRMKLHTDAFGRSIATEAAPALTMLAQAFTINTGDMGDFNVIAELIGGTIRFLATVVLLLKDAFVILGHQAGDVMAGLFHVIDGLGKAVYDVAHGQFKQATTDIKQGFVDMNHDIDQGARDLAKDLKDSGAEIAKLYGFGGDDPSGKRTPGTGGAPMVKPPKPEKEKYPGLKDFLETQKLEIEAMKARYELEEKLEADSEDQTAQKYAKIQAMDEAYLLQVGSIYGFESAEYYNQLKTMEEHHKEHLKAKEKDEAEYAKNVKGINDMMRGWDEEAAKKLLAESKQYAQLTVNAIQSTMRAGFAKGGNVGTMMAAFGESVLSGFGSLLVKMGETHMKFGAIMEPLEKFLFVPGQSAWAAFAIGAALIAMGSALGALGSGGGGGGGGGSGSYGTPSPVNFTGSIGAGGPNAATTTSGMSAQAPVSVTVIGPNDPQAGRQILQLIANAQRR
jgi:hypothetical protein